MIDTPNTLLLRLKWAGIPEPERELRFDPARRWRFDFAWPEKKIAVEIEGGVSDRRRGRHVRARGYQRDCEKYDRATTLGWRVLRFTSADIQEERPGFRSILRWLKKEMS